MEKLRKHKAVFISVLSVILIAAVSLGLYEHNEKQKKIEAENIRIAAQKKADKQKAEKLKKLKEEMKQKAEEEKIKLEKEKKEKQLAEEKEKKQKEEEEAKKKEQEAKDSENNESDSASSKDNSSKSSNKNSGSSRSVAKGFKNAAFNGCSQVLLVKSPSMSSSSAQVSCYEKTDGEWKCVKSDMYSIIGGNGMHYGSSRRQNTNTTPAGIYNIMYMFGWGGNPGVKYQFKVPDDNSYWNLNDGSPTYNRWVEGNPGGDNEHLKTEPLYKYAMVLDYNYEQQKGKGGAIFIHLNPPHYTGGCIGLGESNLVSVMRWLDPGKNPKVLTCSESDLSRYYY